MFSDLLFDCSRVLEYAKIRTVLQCTVVDCKTVCFFLKISKEISPQSRSLFSGSFQTFCLTARAYLNTQKYGLFCSLFILIIIRSSRKLICFRQTYLQSLKIAYYPLHQLIRLGCLTCLEIQHRCQNPCSGLLSCHLILSLLRT